MCIYVGGWQAQTEGSSSFFCDCIHFSAENNERGQCFRVDLSNLQYILPQFMELNRLLAEKQ